MATSSHIKLSTKDRPVFAVQTLSQDSADRTSELLQQNHEKHHIFFNDKRFHNHIVHHLLTIYAIGATPDEIQKQYDLNADYQREAVPLKKEIVEDMHDPTKFKKFLGDEDRYHDFLVFFQDEMDEKGWENVVNEYLFKGDERADDMLARAFAGFLHPIIHLGFGIEFHQPAIIAEALAQTAIHVNWTNKLLFPAEKAAAQYTGPSKTLFELLEEARFNPKLAKAARYGDGNKLRDGILGRGVQEMVELAAKFKVTEETMEEKMAEMINFAAYFTLAAQRPPKRVKLDFFHIHCLNSSIFLPAFLSPTSPLTTTSKLRLLEWKARMDLALHLAQGTPDLLISEIENYTPRIAYPGEAEKTTVAADIAKRGDWESLFRRVCAHDDDGHASKAIRALANGEQISRKHDLALKQGWKIKDDMWLKMGHMAMDSVENLDDSPDWVRNCGFEQAWEKIYDRGEETKSEGEGKGGRKGNGKRLGDMGYEDGHA